jgi:hypothetical protein
MVRSLPISIAPLALVGLALAAAPAAARSDYVDRIPNGGVHDCDNCHGGGAFKSDWDRLGWGAKLARKDSDGDGFSNGEELQDPDGRWRPGRADPGDRGLVSNPGDRRSVPAVEGAPSKKKARCIRRLNQGLVAVAEASGAALRDCVKSAATDEGAPAAGVCAASIDADETVVRRVAKLEKREGRACLSLPNPPPFGATSAETVTEAAIGERSALLADLFGADPDGALLTDAEDGDGARCQRALLSATDRCATEVLEAFEKCKKKGLKQRRIGGVDDLVACLDSALARRRAGRCGPEGTKLGKALARRCDAPGGDLAALFPGCGAAAPEDLVACVAERLRCRACRAVDGADDLGADCDLFDDATADGSCED